MRQILGNQYKGLCKCGSVTFTLILPNDIGSYTPRACDCDYCTNRNASYLSDPQAELYIQSNKPLKKEAQGSEQANFLSCSNCNTLVGVVCSFDTGLKGAVNATLLTKEYQLQSPVTVSPKLLSPDEKLERWEGIWLKVSVDEQENT